MSKDFINEGGDRCVMLPLTLDEAKHIRRILLERTVVQLHADEWEENHELAKFIEANAGGEAALEESD